MDAWVPGIDAERAFEDVVRAVVAPHGRLLPERPRWRQCASDHRRILFHVTSE